MARKFVSPGVFTQELDQSFIATGVGAIGAVVIGRTAKGPGLKPTTVVDFNDFVAQFGDVDPTMMAPYAVKNYLKNASIATVVRVLGDRSGAPDPSKVSNAATYHPVGIVDDTDTLLAVVNVPSGTTFTLSGALAFPTFSFSGSAGAQFTGTYAGTLSFLTSDPNYISNVLNTDPTKVHLFGHWLYKSFKWTHDSASLVFPFFTASLSGATTSTFDTDFTYGVSPWVMSQMYSSQQHQLFRVWTLSAGAAANEDIKVSIASIKASTTPSVTKYGTFDIVVRAYSDTDSRLIQDETFTNVTLDPLAANYLPRVIGDQHRDWNATTQKLVTYGTFKNFSKFIRIEMSTTSAPPADALPWGHTGYPEMLVSTDTVNTTGTYAGLYTVGLGVRYTAVVTGTIGNAITVAYSAPAGVVTSASLAGTGTITVALHSGTAGGFRYLGTGSPDDDVTFANKSATGSAAAAYSFAFLSQTAGAFNFDVGITGTHVDFLLASDAGTGYPTTPNDIAIATATFPSLDALFTIVPGGAGNLAVTATGTTAMTGATGQATFADVFAAVNTAGFTTIVTPVLVGAGTIQAVAQTLAPLTGGTDQVDYTGNNVDAPYVPDNLDDQGNLAAYTYWGLDFLKEGIGDRLKFTGKSVTAPAGAAFSLHHLSSSSSVNGVDYTLYTASFTGNIPSSDGIIGFTVGFYGGFDGFDETQVDPLAPTAATAISTVSLKKALDLIANPDEIDVNLVGLPGITSQAVTSYAEQVVNARADAMYVMDISGSSVTSIISSLNGRGIDDNYTATYYPWLRYADTTNNVLVTVAPSVAVLGAIAYNDRVGQVFFAPAGLNRGGLAQFGIIDTTDRLTFQDRNDLYENRINPIATFPNEGIVIWGQKTLQVRASALDRINVRRLLIYAKKTIASVARFLLFEPNNPQTWQRFLSTVNPILEKVRMDQGLERFKVVMDSTVNTPDLIDRNIMTGKIFLQPTRTAEYIDLSFIITSSGVQFEE